MNQPVVISIRRKAQLKRAEVVLLMLCLSILLAMSDAACDQSQSTARELALEALQREYSWTKKHTVIAKRKDIPFFQNLTVYKLTIGDGPEPSPIFMVAINNTNQSPYVFSSEKDIPKFNKMVLDLGIVLSKTNLRSYIDSMLVVLDYDSKVIDSLSDIEDLPGYVRDDQKYVRAIKPLSSAFMVEEIGVEFFSWNNRGYIRKWSVVFSYGGEILKSSLEEILKLSLYL